MNLVKRLSLLVPRCLPAALAAALLFPLAASSAAQPATAAGQDPWWKHAVVYEIYPRSFQDTNGDGTGDLNGITSRLDYLHHLGVDAIWIAPMFPSPQVDFGYDISDYNMVDPQYGTLADMDRLIAEAKKRGMRVCLDMVLNHTSDKHAWFQQSMTSRDNPKSDWYMWVDGIGPNKDQIPNNWQSDFGHSAWTWNPARKQFYYHKFYAEQPDLNWRNPAVEKAMFDVLRFWLDRGVAGFRLDAIPTLFENPDMKDETPVLDAQGRTSTNAYHDIRLHDTQTNNLPEVQDVLRRMRKLVDSYPGNRVLIGETYVETIGDLDKLYGGAAKDVLQLPMDFKVGMINKLDAAAFRKNIEESYTGLHGSQPLFVFDNHDNPRLDRYCTPDPSNLGSFAGTTPECIAIQKLLSTILFTTHSTALMYYGDEIGMVTTPPTRVEDVKDPVGRTGWPLDKGRDGDRTPMQWTPGPNAGFTSGATPWLPIPPSYKTYNVESETGKPDSLLTWYTTLIRLRRTVPALHDGLTAMVDPTNKDVLCYTRKEANGKDVLVVLNFSSSTQTVPLTAAYQTLVANGTLNGKSLQLPAYGAWVGQAR